MKQSAAGVPSECKGTSGSHHVRSCMLDRGLPCCPRNGKEACFNRGFLSVGKIAGEAFW